MGLSGPQYKTDLSEAELRRLRHIPVIAMTASVIQGDRRKCYGAGMYLSVEAGGETFGRRGGENDAVQL